MKYRLLRLILFASAFVWGISIIAVVMPWSTAITGLNGLGAGAIPNDPMLDYWLRMATAAFTSIGMLYFVTALWPAKYQNLLGLLGLLQVFEGIVLLVHGLRLDLRPFPFYADTAFCLLAGVLILTLRSEAKETSGKVSQPSGETRTGSRMSASGDRA